MPVYDIDEIPVFLCQAAHPCMGASRGPSSVWGRGGLPEKAPLPSLLSEGGLHVEEPIFALMGFGAEGNVRAKVPQVQRCGGAEGGDVPEPEFDCTVRLVVAARACRGTRSALALLR